MAVEIIECEQYSPEWYAARLGLPTASTFKMVMAAGDGKTREDLMMKLAGEICTGEPMDTYSNPDMERGKRMEDEARRMYAMLTDTEPQRVGFIRNGRKGGSPDALIGQHGLLEIKSHKAHVLIPKLLKGTAPPEFMAQFQGNIWIAERDWIDHAGYCPGLPLLKVRVYRDDTYIRKLSLAVDVFLEELDELVDKIKRLQSGKVAVYDDDAIPG